MSKITLKQAAAWCGGFVEEKYENVEFLGACNDTRLLQKGQLFVALQGARDGNAFVPTAMEKGAAAVLCSRVTGDYPAIVVEDTRIALGKIAAGERQRLSMKVVGITGSVGKSTTKEMVAAVLESTFRTAKTPANHNNDIGMPMAILAMPEDTQVAVLEMGMNHFREMAYLSQIGKPDVAVIVNIGTAHIEFLGTVSGILKAKMEIAEGMAPDGLLLLNGDDVMLRNLDQVIPQTVRYFGSDEGCACRCGDIRSEDGFLRFRVDQGERSFPVEMHLEGRHFVSDAMAAIAVGLELGVPPEKIQTSLLNFKNLAGRQETFCRFGFTFIKDCYNAGPESMEASLHVLGDKKGRKIAVLGDMLELGDRASAEHYRVGRIAAERVDWVLAYGPNASRVVSGCLTGGMPDSRALAFSDQTALQCELQRIARPGDVLLFKGSRGMHMENILDQFLNYQKDLNGGNPQ